MAYINGKKVLNVLHTSYLGNNVSGNLNVSGKIFTQNKEVATKEEAATKQQVADLQQEVNNLGTLQVDVVDTSSNILALTSNQGIAVGTDTGYWYSWDGTQYVYRGVYQATEIADGSITYDKLSSNLKENYLPLEINLYNYETAITVGYYRNGGLNSNSAYRTSTDIKVNGGETLHTATFGFYNFWDSEHRYISDVINSSNSEITINVPNNAKYLTIGTTTNNMKQLMINRGETLLSYRPYFKKINAYKYDYTKFDQMYLKDDKVCCNKTSSNTAYYAGIDVGEKATELWLSWIFEKGMDDASNTGTVALIVNPNGLTKVSDITNNSLHITLTATGFRCACLGERYGHFFYNTICEGNFDTPLLLDGTTRYSLYVQIVESAGVVRLKLNNVSIGSGAFVDEWDEGLTLSDFLGNYVSFEHFCQGDRWAKAMPQFVDLTIKTPTKTIRDHFKGDCVRLTSTPYGQNYVLISNIESDD